MDLEINSSSTLNRGGILSNRNINAAFLLICFLPVLLSFRTSAGPDPCSATPLANNMLEFIEIELFGGSSGIEDPGCGDYPGEDDWYSIVVPPSGSVAIELEAGTVTDAGFALYTGSCSAPLLYNCVPNYRCGEDPMAKYFYENLTPGTLVYLRIWSMDGTLGTVFIRVADPYGNPYILTGNAQPVSFQGQSNCIQLTTAVTGQLGCAWYPVEVDFSEPFDFSFNLYLGNNDGGADGMVIVFQNNGIPICGTAGGGIGYEGILNSWAVEFDTWQNTQYGDPFQDHVAININGNMSHQGHPPVVLPNIEDGEFHGARVTWDPSTMTFNVFFDGVLRITTVYDIVNNIFGGDPLVHWGVTASTGGAVNDHILCFENIELENLVPVYVDTEETICYGEEIFLGGGWQTEEGEYIDYYIAANGCDSIVTTDLFILPEVFPNIIDTLLCENAWLEVAGQYFDQEGYYEIMLQNADGCDSLIQITIEYVIISALIEQPPILTCLDTIIELNVQISSPADNIEYFWYTNSGNIISGNNTQSIEVDAPGQYFVEISYFDGTVACGPLVLNVWVEADQETPLIDLNVIGELGCDESTVIIDAGGSIGGNIYDWYVLSGGDIISGTGTTQIEVDGPGTYSLILTNGVNFCSWEQQIVIVQGALPPVIVIDSAARLSCRDSLVVIDAGGSSQGSEFIYQWTTIDGRIVSGQNTLTPTVAEPGWYTLLITNQDNGCEIVDSVEIRTDFDTILISISRLDTITCANPQAQLIITLNPEDTEHQISWLTPDGNITNQQSNGRHIFVDVAATYIVTVINAQNGCESRLSVDVDENTTPPDAVAATPERLDCTDPEINLSGIGSSMGSGITYLWTTQNGIILSGAGTLMPRIGREGLYVLTVRDSVNGCTSSAAVVVEADAEYPSISLMEPEILDCRNQINIIDGSGSSTGSDFEILWSTTDGNIVMGENSLNPTVDQPGIYVIRILNTSNGCVSFDSIEVLQDINTPTSDAGMSSVLTCQLTEINLDGSGSSQGASFSYNWSTSNGNILSGGNSLDPVINAPGFYFLTVTDESNGCTAVSQVEIIADAGLPTLIVAPLDTLNCLNQSVFINAVGSSQGADFQLFWNTTDGSIINIINPLLIEVDQPGTYTLEIINTQNQCAIIRIITVDLDIEQPDIDTGPGLVLNCKDREVSPSLEGQIGNQRYDYLWTTVDGIIQSGINTLLPTFTAPGNYQLRIIDTINHCITDISLLVTEDIEAPLVVINPVDTLTCSVDFLDIRSTGSSSGSEFSYQWSTQDGNITGPMNGSIISIDQPGYYFLEIMNLENHCTALDSILVVEDRDFPDIAFLQPDTLTCRDTIIDLSAAGSSAGPGFSFSWNTSQGLIVGPGDIRDIRAGRPGVYYLEVSNANNNCKTLDSVVVGQNIIQPNADAGAGDRLTCDRSAITLSGSGASLFGPVSAEWTSADGIFVSGQNSFNPVVNRAGVYTLTVFDPYNGCFSEDNVIVLPNEDSIISVDLGLRQPDCFVNTGNVRFNSIDGGEAPFEYSINGGSSFSGLSLYQNLAPGIYNLIVRDVNGCTLSTSIELVEIFPVKVDLPPLYIIELGDQIQLDPFFNIPESAIDQYIWEPGRWLDCDDCPYPVSSPLEQITYRLRVIDENGCEDIAETLIRVIRSGGVYIPSAFTPGNRDGINDRFTVFGRQEIIKEVNYLKIFDRWGNQVFLNEKFPVNDEASGWDGSYRSSEMTPAVFTYVAEVEFINGVVEKYFGDVTLIR